MKLLIHLFALSSLFPVIIAGSCAPVLGHHTSPGALCGEVGTLSKPAPLGDVSTVASASACSVACASIDAHCVSFSYAPAESACQLYSKSISHQDLQPDNSSPDSFYDQGCWNIPKQCRCVPKSVQNGDFEAGFDHWNTNAYTVGGTDGIASVTLASTGDDSLTSVQFYAGMAANGSTQETAYATLTQRVGPFCDPNTQYQLQFSYYIEAPAVDDGAYRPFVAQLFTGRGRKYELLFNQNIFVDTGGQDSLGNPWNTWNDYVSVPVTLQNGELQKVYVDLLAFGDVPGSTMTILVDNVDFVQVPS